MTRPVSRFEIKYRITPALAAEIQDWLPRYMQADANGEGGSPIYRVHSLYLDSPDWSIYRDTRNGAYARFKLRARCYDFRPTSDMFLEVKSRAGESMRKSRGVVSRKDAMALMWDDVPPTRSNADIEAFRLQMDRRQARPRLWVTYRRHAYVGGERGLIRVTFDDEIACAGPTRDLSEPPRWHLLPEVLGLVVLEVKYSGSYPGWVAELVRRFGLERRSMSKYKQGVDVYRALPAHLRTEEDGATAPSPAAAAPLAAEATPAPADAPLQRQGGRAA